MISHPDTSGGINLGRQSIHICYCVFCAVCPHGRNGRRVLRDHDRRPQENLTHASVQPLSCLGKCFLTYLNVGILSPLNFSPHLSEGSLCSQLPGQGQISCPHTETNAYTNAYTGFSLFETVPGLRTPRSVGGCTVALRAVCLLHCCLANILLQSPCSLSWQ